MARKKLIVRVAPFVRTGGVHVRGHVRRIRDVGAPGRTPPSKRWFRPKGKLAIEGMEWHAMDPAGKRRMVLIRLARRDGYATVIRRLNALRNVSTSREVDRAAKMDMKWLRSRRERGLLAE